MDSCPEKDLLEKFIENELPDEMNKEIMSHMHVCDKCRDMVMRLITNEKSFLQTLFESGSHRKKVVPSSEKCPPKAALLAYAMECLDSKKFRVIESHLEKCNKCLHELIELQEKLSLPSEVELDMSVLEKSEQETVRTPKDILEIVFTIKRNILEVISHTGELLRFTPQLGTIRGKEFKREEAIVIRKDFKDKDLSIEMKFGRQVDEHGTNINVSAMRLSTEEFLSGMDVTLSGSGVYRQGKTNEDGEIEFSRIKAGSYEIILPQDTIALLTIK
jgi:hypothetical protein